MKNQKGSSPLVIVLVLVALVAIGLVGYNVLKSGKSKDNKAPASSQTTPEAPKIADCGKYEITASEFGNDISADDKKALDCMDSNIKSCSPAKLSWIFPELATGNDNGSNTEYEIEKSSGDSCLVKVTYAKVDPASPQEILGQAMTCKFSSAKDFNTNINDLQTVIDGGGCEGKAAELLKNS